MKKLSRTQIMGLIYLLLAILFLLAVAPFPVAEEKPLRKAIFLQKGIVSYTLPKLNERGYGSMAAGMYGAFVEYVGLLGYDASVVKELPESFDDVDLMVFTNPDFSFPDETHEKIWKFVEDGGLLWVLGDHTFIKNGTNHCNTLLSPTGIYFENDSAKHFVQGWFESYEKRLVPPISSRIRDDAENSFGMLVGASLRIHPPATPILIGRYGYADIGLEVDPENRGHLGDFKYKPNERLGDMVLIAGQPYGKGQVIVFGDTTSFFNGNTAKTHRLIQAVVSYLNYKAPWSHSASFFIRLIPFLLLAGIVVVSFRREPWPHVPILFGVTMLYALFWQQGAHVMPFVTEQTRERLALIDFSRNPDTSKHGGMQSSLAGLSINVMRNGLLPVTPDHWDRVTLDQVNLLFLMAPQKPFSGKEVQDLKDFMGRGGTIIMTCGRSEAAANRPFLGEMGLDILNVPLGRFFDRQALGGPVSFFSVWPIYVTGDNVEVLTTHETGMPLIVRKTWGAGSLVLIGDAQFFHNKNLEGDGNHDINNVRFFRRLMQAIGATVEEDS